MRSRVEGVQFGSVTISALRRYTINQLTKVCNTDQSQDQYWPGCAVQDNQNCSREMLMVAFIWENDLLQTNPL